MVAELAGGFVVGDEVAVAAEEVVHFDVDGGEGDGDGWAATVVVVVGGGGVTELSPPQPASAEMSTRVPNGRA